MLNAYNSSCDEFSRTLNAPVYGGQGQVRQSNQRFAGRIRAHASALARCLNDAAQDFGRVRHAFADERSRTEYQKLSGKMAEFGEWLETHAGDIADKNMFKLVPASN